MAHYAVEMKDGSIIPLETFGGATGEECVARWANAAAVVRCVPIEPGDIPADRSKRNVSDWKLAESP